MNINESSLFSCDAMWQGIIVEPGGEVNVIGNSSPMPAKIQNAIVAIQGEGNGASSGSPKIFVNLAEFDNNLTAIALEDDNYSSSMIQQSFFRCSSQMMNKAPHLGVYPEYHILLNEATSVAMGGGPSLNEFEDVFSGIRVNKSSLNIQKSLFKDLMDNNVSPSVKGIGIVASNTTATAQTIEVDSRFENLNRGMQVSGNFNVDVHDNFSTKYFRDIDDVAIFVNSMNYLRDISVVGISYFLNCNIGILLRGNNWNSVNISGNEFDNTHFKETRTGSFHNTAITVQKWGSIPANTGFVEIFDNNITDFRIGIHARNIFDISVGSNPSTYAPNSITFSQTSFDDQYRGIWVENSNNAKIQENEIIQISSAIPSGSYTVEGISIDNCQNAILTSNELNELYSPIRLKGSCIGTELHCNTMDNSMHETGNGVNIDGADVSNQGIDISGGNSLDETWDNLWLGYNSSVKGIIGTPGQQFNWYFDLGLPNGEPFPAPGSANPQGLNPDNSDGCTLNLIPTVHERDSQFGKIAEDSIEYANYEEVFKYNNKLHLYQLIEEDTTLLTWSTSKDTSFRSFYDRNKQSNINLFDRVDSLISVNSLDAAGDLNNAIEDTTTIETNLKIIYGFLINKVFRDSILNSSDSSSIEAVATQHSLEGGFGVFWARALLFLEIHDNSVSSRMGQTTNTDFQIISLNETPIELILMPNPTDEECTIKINGAKVDFYLRINNMFGENVF